MHNPLVRYLYTSNPFYLISATLVLIGLQMLFAPGYADETSIAYDSWMLLQLLAGYILLLAGAGFLIGRYGVWEDARTILLSIVLLFVATSASFDPLLLNDAEEGRKLLLAGFALAVIVSELLLHGLKIRLPILFRLPFHLTLALFFLYPVLLMHLLGTVGDLDADLGYIATILGVLLFPTAGGVVALSLLPAIWKGPGYVANNGTPWGWPLYPWSLFFFLGVGVLLRSYYLTNSFHPFPGIEAAFALYFLTPFFLCIAVVVFELGRSIESLTCQRLAVFTPVLLLWGALPGYDHTRSYFDFLNAYMSFFGAPIQAAWWGLLILFAYVWLRGSREHTTFTIMLIGLGSVIGPDTLDLGSLRFPTVMPLAITTVSLFIQAIWIGRRSVPWFLASMWAVLTAAVAFWDTSFTAASGFLPINLILAASFLISLIDDPFGQDLKRLAPLTTACYLLACAQEVFYLRPIPQEVLTAYFCFTAIGLWIHWYLYKNKFNVTCAAAATVALVLHLRTTFMTSIRMMLDTPGAILVIAGLLCFCLGLVISFLKAKMKLKSAEA